MTQDEATYIRTSCYVLWNKSYLRGICILIFIFIIIVLFYNWSKRKEITGSECKSYINKKKSNINRWSVRTIWKLVQLTVSSDTKICMLKGKVFCGLEIRAWGVSTLIFRCLAYKGDGYILFLNTFLPPSKHKVYGTHRALNTILPPSKHKEYGTHRAESTCKCSTFLKVNNFPFSLWFEPMTPGSAV